MIKGDIFNIQRFSTHDGPGIRTTVFFKGCPLRCYWCQNPESQDRKPNLLYNTELCTGCGMCAERCLNKATVRTTGPMIAIDRSKCTLCGVCVKECPAQARTIAGRSVTAQEVMDVVMKDYKVYLNSGGGMTLSGGEVTGQPEFALRLLKMAKENQIHTAIETCGYVQWEVLRTLLEYTDYVMYDLKCMDSERHRRGTGVGNELILQNARRVAEWKPTLFRTPLIPGYNDDEENIMAAARFIREELGLPQGYYELLKYNRMGEVKYGRMAREDEPHMQPQSDEYFDRLNKMVAEV